MIEYIKISLHQQSAGKLFTPFVFGFFGYAIFLLIMYVLKSIASVMNPSAPSLSFYQALLISLTGFILFFAMKIIEIIKN